MQLEEERKSHKEREQQMKIDNLSCSASLPEFDKDAGQVQLMEAL